MVPTPPPETKAAAQFRLTAEMLRLGHKINQHEPGGPERLELLRQQASLSDEREALRSTRV
jgi:hypothetical protein